MAAKSITVDQLCALRMFRDTLRNKRTWRAALSDVWMRGREWDYAMGRELRQVRNEVGPSGLASINLDRPVVTTELDDLCARPVQSSQWRTMPHNAGEGEV